MFILHTFCILYYLQVFEWFKRFKEGRETTEYDPRPGRPSTSKTDENIEKIALNLVSMETVRACSLSSQKNLIALIDETLESQSTSSSNSTLKANDLAKEINVLEALHLANEAWNNVSDVTIRNCFRHGGFDKTDEQLEKEEDSCPIETPEDLL
ncbi:hypothetical protein NQ318_007942 [Aromia moschata]|uniref:DDE-1 domain-containing protein n=1 Tax=Aromia moschata TaxID=1265417 RepID=A0AAV8YBG5_9CUCU|nr:hypothetical protein NQ318_007942 [Aromia moschata]